VGVDVLVNLMPPAARRRYVLAGLAAGALFTLVIGTVGARYVWAIGHTSQTSADLELPLWIVYLCIPGGSLLMCFRFLQVAWTFSRTERFQAQRGGGGGDRRRRPGGGGRRQSSSQATAPVDDKVVAATRTRTRRTPVVAVAGRAGGAAAPGARRRSSPPTALVIFTLLVGLMLTGMPISIALGLTVLSYLFADGGAVTSVALKLFTGIEKFEIMAIPFFILAGNFLTHGGWRADDCLCLGVRGHCTAVCPWPA